MPPCRVNPSGPVGRQQWLQPRRPGSKITASTLPFSVRPGAGEGRGIEQTVRTPDPGDSRPLGPHPTVLRPLRSGTGLAAGPRRAAPSLTEGRCRLHTNGIWVNLHTEFVVFGGALVRESGGATWHAYMQKIAASLRWSAANRYPSPQSRQVPASRVILHAHRREPCSPSATDRHQRTGDGW